MGMGCTSRVDECPMQLKNTTRGRILIVDIGPHGRLGFHPKGSRFRQSLRPRIRRQCKLSSLLDNTLIG
jgi:hypothetical protein